MTVDHVVFFLAMAIYTLLLANVYYRLGKRAGLRAPLSHRQRALSAEVRRAENARGAALPRIRSGLQNRREQRRSVD